MKILAIDPGYNTGIAVVDTDGNECQLLTLGVAPLMDCVDNLLPADVVIIETIPQGTTNVGQRELLLLLVG